MGALIASSVLIAAARGKLDLERVLRDHGDEPVAIATITAAGKAAGILTSDEALARGDLAAGCSFVAVGVDTTLFARATTALAERFKAGAPGNSAAPAG